jgi:hypothetical protein
MPRVAAKRGAAKRVPSIRLDVLLYPEEGRWAAHCLQLDLVECAGSARQAEKNLVEVIGQHIAWAIEDDNLENLFHPAPGEYWKRLFTARPGGIRLITIPLTHRRGAPALPRVSVQRLEAAELVA